MMPAATRIDIISFVLEILPGGIVRCSCVCLTAARIVKPGRAKSGRLKLRSNPNTSGAQLPQETHLKTKRMPWCKLWTCIHWIVACVAEHCHSPATTPDRSREIIYRGPTYIVSSSRAFDIHFSCTQREQMQRPCTFTSHACMCVQRTAMVVISSASRSHPT